jgi:hypothetical protein
MILLVAGFEMSGVGTGVSFIQDLRFSNAKSISETMKNVSPMHDSNLFSCGSRYINIS